ncbi:DUF6234 family protein [Streptomyces sp. NPDC005492]|uniref:DUF6234 family protein n=1 Tax=Streptomyces sp. NPDC005492 TaxID=3156883 RepID=UPI0033A4B1F9
MTQVPPESPSRLTWPWSGRTPLGPDIATAILLFILEAAVYAAKMFDYGLENWAAQGNQDEMDTATLASISWTQMCVYAVLALAVLAALSRAPWTLVSHLLLALLLTTLLGGAQQDYDRAHPSPTSTPTVRYSPCYSGSGTCH